MNDIKEKLKSLDPTIFTEEVQNELVKIVEEKIEAAKKEALEEGFSRAADKLDEEHAGKLQEILEKLKGDHQAELDRIDEDHASKLEKLIESIDEDHTEKLKTIVEKIDEDHANKFEMALEALDADHTQKLQDVVNFFESKYEGQIVEKISDYLDTYLEEAVPSQQIVDSVKLQRLEEAVNKMKEILVISDDFVQSEISEAVLDAKSQLDEKDAQINELLAEKIELTKKLKRNEATELLERKTASMAPAKAAYITKYFEGSTVEEISERLDEAVQAFEEDQEKKRELLRESAGKTVADQARTPKEELIQENQDEDNQIDPQMAQYVQRIQKSHHARK